MRPRLCSYVSTYVCAHKTSGGLDPEPSSESSKLWIKPLSSVKTGQRHVNPTVRSGLDSCFVLPQTGGQLPKYERCQLTRELFYTQYNMSPGRYLPVQGRKRQLDVKQKEKWTQLTYNASCWKLLFLKTQHLRVISHKALLSSSRDSCPDAIPIPGASWFPRFTTPQTRKALNVQDLHHNLIVEETSTT